MKKIDLDTSVGFDERGFNIHAGRLSKWAYNQLASAPELLGACKEAKELLEGLDRAEKWKLGTVYDDICQTITKAEGK